MLRKTLLVEEAAQGHVVLGAEPPDRVVLHTPGGGVNRAYAIRPYPQGITHAIDDYMTLEAALCGPGIGRQREPDHNRRAAAEGAVQPHIAVVRRDDGLHDG